jgi:Tol biopolymer transport system component
MLVLLMLAAVAAAVSLSQPAQVAASSAQSFTMEQLKRYPFPSDLTASGSRIAWVFNERGARNVWVADEPDFKLRRLTSYETDDGQELTSVSISKDGKYVVYVRGGDHGSNWESSIGVNPALSTTQGRVQMFSIPFSGGEPKLLGEGDEPSISPKSDRVVFLKERGVWTGRVERHQACQLVSLQ